MIYHSDFRDLFYWLNETKVDYLIVGGYAVAFHGAPRFTGNIDVLVRPDRGKIRNSATFPFKSTS